MRSEVCDAVSDERDAWNRFQVLHNEAISDSEHELAFLESQKNEPDPQSSLVI